MSYPSTKKEFDQRFPDWQVCWFVPQSKFNVPGSEWTEEHCADLRVIEELQEEGSPIPQLQNYARDAIREVRENETLQTYLKTLSSVKQLRVPPEQLAMEAGPFMAFYSLLAIVIERIPTQVIGSYDVLGTRNSGRVVNPDFRTGSELTTSSSFNEPMGEAGDGLFESSSQDTACSDEDKESIKSETATQNMAIAFLMTTLTSCRLNNWDPTKRMRPEFSPVTRRCNVSLAKTGFEYVSVDDGGVDIRGYGVNGRWTTLSYPRSACIECKRHVIDALPQHVAEMVGMIVEKLSFAGVNPEDESSIAKLTDEQRTVFVVSVQGKMLEVRGATFSVAWLHETLGRQQDYPSSPPEHIIFSSGHGSEDSTANDDAMAIDTHSEQPDEAEVGNKTDGFLQVYTGITHDLLTAEGRIAAATDIKALVDFIEDNSIEPNEAMDEM